MKNTFTLFFTLMTLASFGQSYDTTHIAVIPLDTSHTWSRVLEGNKPVKLSNAQVRRADSILRVCIAQNNNNGNPSAIAGQYIGIHTFKKQMVPSVNAKGEVILWVNCLCEDFFQEKRGGSRSTRDWKKDPVIIYDGGAGGCFFNVKINLTTGKYYDLMVNGI